MHQDEGAMALFLSSIGSVLADQVTDVQRLVRGLLAAYRKVNTNAECLLLALAISP